MKRPPRATSNLSESAHRQLSMYALAASAAGVRMLTLAQPSEVKIVIPVVSRALGAALLLGTSVPGRVLRVPVVNLFVEIPGLFFAGTRVYGLPCGFLGADVFG